MEKDADCGESENHRENDAAVAIKLFGPLRLLVVIQDCRYHDLN
jgi:hypothetical protein